MIIELPSVLKAPMRLLSEHRQYIDVIHSSGHATLRCFLACDDSLTHGKEDNSFLQSALTTEVFAITVNNRPELELQEQTGFKRSAISLPRYFFSSLAICTASSLHPLNIFADCSDRTCKEISWDAGQEYWPSMSGRLSPKGSRYYKTSARGALFGTLRTNMRAKPGL